MMNTARVYDSDICPELEETLRNLAAAVALTYTGNWESMIGWKRHCENAQPLSIKDIRTILNMALSDQMQAGYHAEIRQYLHRFVPPPRPEPPPRLRVVRDPEPPKRRWWVKVRARFRADVFKPDHKMGKIHLVDHGRTFVEWSIPHHGFRQAHEDDPKVPKLVVFGWCGKRYDNVLIPDNLEPEDAEMCAGCRRVRCDVGLPPSETRECR